MILHTPFYHANEAHVIEHPEARVYHAIRNADAAALLQAISEGYDIDYHANAHTPALIYALGFGHYDTVRLMLEYGANVSISDAFGNTPLHVAYRNVQSELLHLLLRFGADMHARDRRGKSVLQLAIDENNTAMIELLRATPAIPYSQHDIFAAARSGELYELLPHLKSHADLAAIESGRNNLLHLAVKKGEKALLCYLLNRGIDIDSANSHGDTILLLAIRYRRSCEILRFLIERRATLEHKNGNGHTALGTALRIGYAEAAELLIDSGANVHAFDGIHTMLTLCHNAIKTHREFAPQFRKIEAQMLIKGAGVDVSTNDLGWTPIMQTASRQSDRLIFEHLQLLIELGGDVNQRDKNGRTALMLAASMGRMDALKLLLKNYANTEVIDMFGWNALMLSVYYKHLSIAVELLEYGANADVTTKQGLSALKIARQSNQQIFIELLQSFGATESESDQRE